MSASNFSIPSAPTGGSNLEEHSARVTYGRGEGRQRLANGPTRISLRLPSHETRIRTPAGRLGPVAGYFSSRSRTALRLQAVSPAIDAGMWPMTFDIAVGVRGSEPELRDEKNAILEQHRPAIERILDDFHVPRFGSAITPSK